MAKRLCVSMPTPTYEWLDAVARQTQRSKSNYITVALEEMRRREEPEGVVRSDSVPRRARKAAG